MYAFLGNLASQVDKARANPPIITPTTIEEMPIDAANTARAPAPTVQSGQCANAIFGKNATVKRNDNFFISIE
jgi:3-deoxy-D-arabino-heptulosonate 7-phosphate (DAHP) synthase class II